MPDAASAVLAPWSNFYVIAGSAAAGLTGLMFVVITLVVGLERSQRSEEGIATFSTPTVAHFCVALVVSASMSAPWRSLAGAATMLGAIGIYGLLYVLWVMYRARRQTSYRPEFEDWLWYTILPFAAYLVLVIGAIALGAAQSVALFGIAGGTIFLILIGIHNAWDVVTYIALGKIPAAGAQSDQRADTAEEPRPGEPVG